VEAIAIEREDLILLRHETRYAARMSTGRWWFALVFAAGCGPTLSEDFDAFCGVVNDVNRDLGMPTADKLAKISSRSAEYSRAPESTAPGNVWQKMNETPAESRYAFITGAARSAGKSDWKCNGYEKLLVTYTVEASIKKNEEEKKAAEAAKPDAGVSPDAGSEPEKATKKVKKKKARKKRRRSSG
jgi:hypothetical protein